jgi:hypothetical protein
MLASNARVVPEIADENRDPDRGFTVIVLSSWTSSTSELSSIDNVPLPPFTETAVPDWLNSTPCGNSTGSLATLDIVVSRLIPVTIGR